MTAWKNGQIVITVCESAKNSQKSTKMKERILPKPLKSIVLEVKT